MSEKPSAKKILELMEVGGDYPNVFVVGSLDRRVTFYAQQVRAINLAVALHRENRLPQGVRVAVIGAGIAGVTASVALAAKGASVTLLESADRPMSHQRVTSHRWVHPHIYDWPKAGWDENDAGLPVMNWQAGYPSDFIPQQLDPQWRWALELYPDRLRLHARVKRESLQIRRQEGAYRLTWHEGEPPNAGRGDFQSLVLCVGFGIEESEVADTKPYWFQDTLRNPSRGRTATYLVSGTGDGGLTDALRIKLQDFEHSLIRDWASSPCALELGRRLLDAERRESVPDVERLYEEEAKQFARDPSVELTVRDDVNVTLNGVAETPYSPGASRLNKLLVAALIADGAIVYLQGKLGAEIKDRGPQHKGGRYGIVLGLGDQGDREYEFDHVVLRHGPGTPPPLEELHKGIWQALASYRDRRDSWSLYFNEARVPIWDVDDFPRLDYRIPDGWKSIDRPFLDSEAHAFKPYMLKDFFDGSDPQWSVIASQRLFERGLTQAIIEGISRKRDEKRAWSLHLLVGPGGEGKSTIVRQCAARIARQHGDWTILFREADGDLKWSEMQSVVSNQPLILISDQSHELLDRGRLARFIREVSSARSNEALRDAEVHLVLCANESNWKPDSRRNTWLKDNAVSSYLLEELSSQDATGIVTSQAREGALGNLANLESDEVRAERLLELARGHRHTSLLGALLAARTGETLEIHVERILDRLDEEGTALIVYATVAILQTYGLRHLDGRLVRRIIHGEWQDVSRIRQILSAEVTSSGLNETLKLRVRHDEIARVAVRLLRAQRSEEWLAERCEQLGRALAIERPDFYRDPIHQLKDLLPAAKQWELAQAFAKGVYDAARDNPYCLTKYAQLLREGGSPEEAERVIRQAHERGQGIDRKVIQEWAIAWGGLSDTHRDAAHWNAWLGLYTLSDEAAGAPPRKSDVEYLTVVAKGASRFGSRHDRMSRLAEAAIRLARAIPGPSQRLEKLLAKHYNEVGVESQPNEVGWLHDAIATLEAASVYLWAQTVASSRPLVATVEGRLSFSGLRHFFESRIAVR